MWMTNESDLAHVAFEGGELRIQVEREGCAYRMRERRALAFRVTREQARELAGLLLLWAASDERD